MSGAPFVRTLLRADLESTTAMLQTRRRYAGLSGPSPVLGPSAPSARSQRSPSTDSSADSCIPLCTSDVAPLLSSRAISPDSSIRGGSLRSQVAQLEASLLQMRAELQSERELRAQLQAELARQTPAVSVGVQAFPLVPRRFSAADVCVQTQVVELSSSPLELPAAGRVDSAFLDVVASAMKVRL